MTPISLRSILILSSNLGLALPKGLFPVGVPVKILKALLNSSILATCPAHLNFLDLITLTILGEGTHYEVPHCGAFSNPHSHPSWAQVFASSSEDKFIVVPSKWSRCLTAPQVHPEVNKSRSKPVSITTVKRRLRDAKSFGRITIQKPLLRPQNKMKRMQWALTHEHWTEEDF